LIAAIQTFKTVVYPVVRAALDEPVTKADKLSGNKKVLGGGKLN